MLIDFDDARRASDEQLRALVRHGDGAERVWAVWAIALRAQGNVRDLVALTASEPDAGVRRHLAVVLASHGEADILVALGRHDPAAAVRGSAMRIVTRLAAAGTVPWAVVVEQLGDRAAEVREAILSELVTAVTEPALEAALRRCLDDAAPEVRAEALAAGWRLRLADLPTPLPPMTDDDAAPATTGPVTALTCTR